MRNRLSFHGKAVAAVSAVALMSAVAGTATALRFTSLETEAFDLFGAPTSDTAFAVTHLDVQLQGEDKIRVKVVAENQGSSPHSADVTVQLRDETDNVLAEGTEATGSVDGGQSVQVKWRFQQPDLARAYDDVFLWFDQTS